LLEVFAIGRKNAGKDPDTLDYRDLGEQIIGEYGNKRSDKQVDYRDLGEFSTASPAYG
jgi:hypothetical protein